MPHPDRIPADQLLESATQAHRAGDITQARNLYHQALAISPTNATAMARLTVLELLDGHAETALPLIQNAIAISPEKPRYHFLHGEILCALSRWNHAAAAYRQSLQIEPRAADVSFALGLALQSAGEWRAAIAAYQSAIENKPDFPDAFNNIGNCHHHLGDRSQAELAYRRALELQPRHARATSNVGVVLREAGRLDEALRFLRAACELEPHVSAHDVNLSAALCDRRQFTEAAALLRPLIHRDPTNPDAARNLGNALAALGQLQEAAEQYQRAEKLRPNDPDVLSNLGNVYKQLGQFQLAATAYESAIKAQPDAVVAMNNHACLLRTLGQLEEAETVLRRAIEIDPHHPTLWNNLGNTLKDLGDLDDAIHCFRQSLSIDPADPTPHSNLAYTLSFSETDPKAILEECLRWNEQHAAPLRSQIRIHDIDRSPGRHLRIGYLSPDFRDHCQSLFTIPLLSHHDHSAFSIHCYSTVEKPDDFTERIAAFADHWHDVRHLDDAQLSDLIRADRIDILVDLTMHMSNGRPLVFARKPAPIQIAFLAYPGTTGISAIDFRLSDPRLDPPEFESHYSERTLRLPDSFWCYDPLTDGPEVNALPALSRGYLTLGCLNNPCKLTDRTIQLWGPIMRALPAARLLLMAPPGSRRQKLLARFALHHISEDRIDFVPFRLRPQYLTTYHQIDIGLDTLPYNGHTTSLDSFWMGVPVITRIGPTCVGRAGLSQLFQLDLLDLAAETDEAFVTAAVRLAHDLPHLAQLRQELRSRMQKSPLMNAERFARNIEAIYRKAIATASSRIGEQRNELRQNPRPPGLG